MMATFTVASNVTTKVACTTGNAAACAPMIETCDPWGVTAKGGVPPYTWTLAQVNSSVITNVTGQGKDDEMVYINRGDVGAIMIGAFFRPLISEFMESPDVLAFALIFLSYHSYEFCYR